MLKETIILKLKTSLLNNKEIWKQNENHSSLIKSFSGQSLVDYVQKPGHPEWWYFDFAFMNLITLVVHGTFNSTPIKRNENIEAHNNSF